MERSPPTRPQSPPPPRGRSVDPTTGCVVAIVLALLPLLYVGSYAALLVDYFYGFNWADWIDARWPGSLRVFYWPLNWVFMQAIELAR